MNENVRNSYIVWYFPFFITKFYPLNIIVKRNKWNCSISSLQAVYDRFTQMLVHNIFFEACIFYYRFSPAPRKNLSSWWWQINVKIALLIFEFRSLLWPSETNYLGHSKSKMDEAPNSRRNGVVTWTEFWVWLPKFTNIYKFECTTSIVLFFFFIFLNMEKKLLNVWLTEFLFDY